MIIKVHGKFLKVVTLGQLAKMGGKSAITLRKWESKGWLPPSNLRTAEVILKNGQKREGRRIYLNSFALKLAEVIAKAKQGKEVPHELKLALYNIIRDERIKLKSYASEKTKGDSKTHK